MLQEDAGPNWAHGAQLRSCTCRPGGSDCLSLSALSVSATTSVYRYFEQRTLNLVMMAPVFLFFDFLIRTAVGRQGEEKVEPARVSAKGVLGQDEHLTLLQRGSALPP